MLSEKDRDLIDHVKDRLDKGYSYSLYLEPLLEIITRLEKALEKCKEQWDGYRDNYHAVCPPWQFEAQLIRLDNDKEISEILEGRDGNKNS